MYSQKESFDSSMFPNQVLMDDGVNKNTVHEHATAILEIKIKNKSRSGYAPFT